MENSKIKTVLAILRLSMGLIFLWAFFDKLLGWGFTTKPDGAWLAGGSPTTGFLQFGVHGPFTEFFNGLAGNAMVDWLFMLGLLFVGVSLTFGILMKLGGTAGMLMLFLMYLAVGLPPEHHPFLDDHFVYIFVILMLILSNSGAYFGFGNTWARTTLVQKYKILK